MAQGDGGHRYCPNCKKVVETRVLPDGYSYPDYRGLSAKKRKIICGIDDQGSYGCGHTWYTLEIEESSLNSI